MSSATQDQWVEMLEAVRANLAKLIPLMPAMTIDELKTFVETLDSAQWLEIKARCWDSSLEREERLNERSIAFGD